MPKRLGELVGATILAFVVVIVLGLLAWAAEAVWSHVL